MLINAAKVLHVGCGHKPLPAWITGEETRLDIDPAVSPDVVASMTALGDVGRFDVVACFHALEHLYAHELDDCLSEFKRVLQDGGMAVVVVPDLEDVRPTDDVLYESSGGPVAGIDMYFGMRSCLKDHPAMAHRNGFVAATLESGLKRHFPRVFVRRITDSLELLGVGVK